jgi:hypothetical protein
VQERINTVSIATKRPDVYRAKSIITRKRRSASDKRLAQNFAERQAQLQAKLAAIVAANVAAQEAK